MKSGGEAGVKWGCFGSGFAHGVSLQGEPVGVVDEAIEDRVGEGRAADGGVPGVDRELAGDDGGGTPLFGSGKLT